MSRTVCLLRATDNKCVVSSVFSQGLRLSNLPPGPQCDRQLHGRLPPNARSHPPHMCPSSTSNSDGRQRHLSDCTLPLPPPPPSLTLDLSLFLPGSLSPLPCLPNRLVNASSPSALLLRPPYDRCLPLRARMHPPRAPACLPLPPLPPPPLVPTTSCHKTVER